MQVYYLFTFIGTVVHEFAHEQAVLSRNLSVEEVSYFSLSGASLGYVKHENPRTYADMFIIGLAPLFVNTVLALCSLTGVFIVYSSPEYPIFVRYGGMIILAWFGLSTALHAFPSSTDVENIIDVKKILWDISKPNIKDTVTTELKNVDGVKNILISIVALPIWIVTTIFHGVKYIFFHPTSAVTVPFIYGLYSTIYLKYIGLHLFYTIGLVYLAQEIYLYSGL